MKRFAVVVLVLLVACSTERNVGAWHLIPSQHSVTALIKLSYTNPPSTDPHIAELEIFYGCPLGFPEIFLDPGKEASPYKYSSVGVYSFDNEPLKLVRWGGDQKSFDFPDGASLFEEMQGKRILTVHVMTDPPVAYVPDLVLTFNVEGASDVKKAISDICK